MSEVNINLEGVLTIARVESLHAELEEIERKSQPVSISAQSVTRVDTAILQLLVAFFRHLAARDISISWNGVSDEFVASARLLGLATDLQLNA